MTNHQHGKVSEACTCPSGDGSLRWPCPAHPAPQQEAQEPCPSCRNSDIYACTCPFPTPRNTAPHPAPAPLSDDTKRLDWMDKDACERVFHVGADWYTRPTYGQPYRKHKNLRAAIDAALAAQGGD